MGFCRDHADMLWLTNSMSTAALACLSLYVVYVVCSCVSNLVHFKSQQTRSTGIWCPQHMITGMVIGDSLIPLVCCGYEAFFDPWSILWYGPSALEEHLSHWWTHADTHTHTRNPAIHSNTDTITTTHTHTLMGQIWYSTCFNTAAATKGGSKNTWLELFYC